MLKFDSMPEKKKVNGQTQNTTQYRKELKSKTTYVYSKPMLAVFK